MSLNSEDNKNNYKKEDNENKRTRRRIGRTYERNDKPSIRRPIGVTALGIASIAHDAI